MPLCWPTASHQLPIPLSSSFSFIQLMFTAGTVWIRQRVCITGVASHLRSFLNNLCEHRSDHVAAVFTDIHKLPTALPTQDPDSEWPWWCPDIDIWNKSHSGVWCFLLIEKQINFQISYSAMWPQASQTHKINTIWPLPKFCLHSLLYSSHTTHTAVYTNCYAYWLESASTTFTQPLHIVGAFPFLRPPDLSTNSTDNPSLAPYCFAFFLSSQHWITIWKCITY